MEQEAKEDHRKGKKKEKSKEKLKEKEEAVFDLANEKVVEVDVERLKTFEDHPFKVCEDEAMQRLKESIQNNGILTPLLVMPVGDGCYQIISGHRRRYCAEALGYKKVPVIIRHMERDESIISMVDANLQRDRISYSEKAFAYKMKNEAMKRKRSREKGAYDARADSVRGKRTIDVLSEESGESARQIIRYIRLTRLIPELLEKLDEEELAFNPAVELSYINEEEQRWLLDAMDYAQGTPSISQAKRIRRLSHSGQLTLERTREILSEVKKGDINQVTFKSEQLYKYFPKDYTLAEIKGEILDMLEQIYG